MRRVYSMCTHIRMEMFAVVVRLLATTDVEEVFVKDRGLILE
jgi:hypothetical protein